LSAIFALLFWWARGPISAILESPAVGAGMAWAAPGLFCFALNKTLLGVLNGLRRMRAYAVAQGLRPVLMIAAFAVVAACGMPPERLPVVLSVSEAVVLIVLAVLVAPRLRWPQGPERGRWVRRHLDFGVRSAGSGVLLELNTRVDVVLLGYFGSDAVVGLYSFAAMLVEGIGQLPIVLRTNVNPLLVQYLATNDRAALADLVRKGRRLTYVVMLTVGAVAVLAYPLGVGLVTRGGDFSASWPLFAILMAGLTVSSGYVPFGQMLLQAGRPGTHTLMTLAILAVNALGNLLLIPLWQATGAAVATAAAYVFSVGLLRVLSRRIAGVAL
jgi:O-antigen/teichoic acid export membrane protein